MDDALTKSSAKRRNGGEKWAAIIHNPIKIDRTIFQNALETFNKKHGWSDHRWYTTSVEDPGGEITKKAIEAGASLVIAAGGDGTVRAVAHALVGSGIPMAIVPVGTGNLLAINLDIPTDLKQAVEIAFTGSETPVDIGIVEIFNEQKFSVSDQPFLVMAGIGADAEMIRNTPSGFKKTFGWLGYIFGGLAALAKQKSFSLHYELSDGREEFITAHSFLIGNCGKLPAGLELIPHAAIDDGILDLVAVRPGGFFGWARVWSEIVLRRKGKKSSTGVGQKINTDDGKIRALRYIRTEGAIIRTEEPIPVELDGDFFGPAIALKVAVLPGAINVRVREKRLSELETAQ
ncbi:MAG: NAD(+)/NADH kinase [Microbacteriaceae bacterium]|nr:NAD(+)/NADH kinase [Microbacteriaceae bacterium]